MASVKSRAALGATLVVAVALVTAGLVMLAVLRENLGEQVNLQAENDGRDVAGQLATDVPFSELRLDGMGPVQVVDHDGNALAVSEGLQAITGTLSEQVVARPEPETEPVRHASEDDGRASEDDGDDDDDDSGDDDGGGDDGDDDTGQDGLLPSEVDDEPGMVNGTATVNGNEEDYVFAVVQVTTARGVEAIVYAGSPVGVEQAAVDSVRTSMAVGVPVLLAVVGGVTWLTTRRAFRPVEGIRREMAAITHSEDLSRRVPEPGARDEIGRLATTTNETLAALEASVERQRRFVADASHELRSPIASLRTQLEVGEAHPELLDLPGAVKDTVRLQALAADLLLLARLDAGERPLPGRVGLASLVAEEIE
ncbi:histidine kinase dimerization/phospho-acceptor domain-containing protein, partial [Streptomyces sp. SBT349]|uniref:histidine kinase dimerization/phospho-acceptor domain-containing protein n=1 Tax=Streptomyces sp. SBT349 TaxID=1580539 RepID=UPI00066CB606